MFFLWNLPRDRLNAQLPSVCSSGTSYKPLLQPPLNCFASVYVCVSSNRLLGWLACFILLFPWVPITWEVFDKHLLKEQINCGTLFPWTHCFSTIKYFFFLGRQQYSKRRFNSFLTWKKYLLFVRWTFLLLWEVLSCLCEQNVYRITWLTWAQIRLYLIFI